MHTLIDAQRTAIAAICRRHQVRRLEVFGSAARGTDFDPARSDVDFLVEFSREALPDLEDWLRVRGELAELLGRDVDLVEYPAVRNPYVRADIEHSRELIYAA